MFPGPEWAELHDQVLKWGLASVSLIVNACRGNDRIESLGPKGDGILTEEELEVFKEVPVRARPTVLWCWTLMLVAKLSDEFGIAPGKYRDVAMECVAARNGISLIWTYLKTQLPFAYVHLVTFLVNLNNLVVSIKCGVVLAMAMKAEAWPQCVNQLLYILVVPPLYQGLLGISHVIHDPFGEDLLDFPVMAFQEITNESCVSVTGWGYMCPALRQTWRYMEKLGVRAETKMKDDSNSSLNPLSKEASGLLTETNPDEVREIVDEMDLVMQSHLNNKDKLIAVLRNHVQSLEENASEMAVKIQSLEQRLL